MSNFLPHCFPHATSCTDRYAPSDSEYECRDDLFDLNRFVKTIHSGLDLTIEGARKLGHYLLLFMWRLILKSRMLFRVRNEFVEQVKMLEKFCWERQEEFASRVCYSNHLFQDVDVELFDDLENWDFNSKIQDESREYEGEKRIKLDSEARPKVFTLTNYFNTLIKKYVFGELCNHAITETNRFVMKQNKNALTFQIEGLRDLVLKYFEYTPSMLPLEDQNVTQYFIGMTALLEYLASELIELAGNAAYDSQQSHITSSGFEVVVARDSDLERTLFFNMSHLPLVDFNCLYGANQALLPTIEVKEKVKGEEYNFTQIPPELHHNILKNLCSLEELLEMRLVCKQWNHFVMNDNEIWKRLICNNMIAENLFRFCDSSFTVNELEAILRRGKDLKPLYFGQQVVNYFYENNDWKSLYFILVRKHLTFIRDLDLMKSREFFVSTSFDTEEQYDNSKEKLQIGITTGLWLYHNLTKHASSRSSSKVYIPKDYLSEFSQKFGMDCTVMGVIDFSKFSSFISYRLFPKTGLLYCFYYHENDENKINRSEFFFIDNYSLESEDMIELEIDAQVVEPLYRLQEYNEQVMVNQPSCCSFFYLQRLQGCFSSSWLAPCFSFNTCRVRPRTMIESYQDDNIVLLSEQLDHIELFSVYISRKDLIARRFDNAKIEYIKPLN